MDLLAILMVLIERKAVSRVRTRRFYFKAATDYKLLHYSSIFGDAMVTNDATNEYKLNRTSARVEISHTIGSIRDLSLYAALMKKSLLMNK